MWRTVLKTVLLSWMASLMALCSACPILLLFTSVPLLFCLHQSHDSSPSLLLSLTSLMPLHSNPLLLRPTCQWFKDGVKLTEKSHQINNKERTLTFKSASPDDNGLYYCCAKNAAGHVCSNSNFTLNIIGVCQCMCGLLSQCLHPVRHC